VSGVVKVDGPFRNDGTYGRRAAGWVALNMRWVLARPAAGRFRTRREAIAAVAPCFAA
jgi:hypothetical protein